MTHAALAPGIGREFEPFLFASIGEGRHGHSLSVISALAQADFDPWLEAVGLAKMSRELAAARLSRLIVSLPDRPASARPPDAIAAELVALLPRGNNSVPGHPPAPPSDTDISEPSLWAWPRRYSAHDDAVSAALDTYGAGTSAGRLVPANQRQRRCETLSKRFRSPPLRSRPQGVPSAATTGETNAPGAHLESSPRRG